MASDDVLASYDGIIDIAASYNLDDNNRAVIVATRNGDVRELFYQVTQSAAMPAGIGDSVIANFGGIARVAAFYNEDDDFRVAIVALRDGDIWEVFYHPTKGKGQSIIAHVDGVVDIAGFYAPDDGFRIVLAASRNAVHEIFYHPTKGKGQSVVGEYQDITAISAYHARATNERSLWVATGDGKLHYRFYHPQRQPRTGHNAIGTLIDLAANSDEQFLATKAGAIRRLQGGEQVDLASIDGLEHIAVDHRDASNLIYSTGDGKLHKKLFW